MLFICLISFLIQSTSLIQLVRSNNIKDVTQYLNQNQNVISDIDEFGRSSLHHATSVDMVKLLLAYKADPYIKDQFKRIPFKYMIQKAERGFLKNEVLNVFVDHKLKLVNNNKDDIYYLHTAAKIGNEKLVNYLINTGGPLKSTNANGGTLIHSLVYGGLLEQIKKITKTKTVDWNQVNRYGLSLLSLAAIKGNTEIINYLIKNGVRLEEESHVGLNAANYAEQFGLTKIVKLLQTKGLNANQNKVIDYHLPTETYSAKASRLANTSSFFYDHSSPIINPEKTEVFWATSYTDRGDFIYRIKKINGYWRNPEILKFNRADFDYMYPTLSYDGKALFYSSNQTVGKKSTMMIWKAEKRGNEWVNHKKITNSGDTYAISVSKNGTIYLMSYMNNSLGSSDIYQIKLTDGIYQEPENLGEKVNSVYYEDEPFIDPNERYLIYRSLRPTKEKYDPIYIIYKEGEKWLAPINIRNKIKFAGNIRFLTVSRDKSSIYFASNINGNWDMYQMSAEGILN